MLFLKKIVEYTANMSTKALNILRLGLILSCLILAAAAMVMLRCGDVRADTYSLYSLARELYSLPVSVMLISLISCVCVEDAQSR